MKRLAAFGLILLVSCIARADDARRDGNWWRELTASQRQNYMIGFFDGMDLGASFSYWGIEAKSGSVDPSAVDAVKSYNIMQEKYMKDVTNVQISDGLTKFYEDYRNRKIMIPKAVWLVLNSIQGKSHEEMDKMTESFRKYATP